MTLPVALALLVTVNVAVIKCNGDTLKPPYPINRSCDHGGPRDTDPRAREWYRSQYKSNRFAELQEIIRQEEIKKSNQTNACTSSCCKYETQTHQFICQPFEINCTNSSSSNSTKAKRSRAGYMSQAPTFVIVLLFLSGFLFSFTNVVTWICLS